VTRGARANWLFGGASALVFGFLSLPLALIVLYAFNKSTINSWPFPGFSTRWFTKLAHDPDAKDAALLSVQIALFATTFALLLGTSHLRTTAAISRPSSAAAHSAPAVPVPTPK